MTEVARRGNVLVVKLWSGQLPKTVAHRGQQEAILMPYDGSLNRMEGKYIVSTSVVFVFDFILLRVKHCLPDRKPLK